MNAIENMVFSGKGSNDLTTIKNAKKRGTSSSTGFLSAKVLYDVTLKPDKEATCVWKRMLSRTFLTRSNKRNINVIACIRIFSVLRFDIYGQ